ncbi:nitrate/nitrite transporter [Rothia terrae]|uniref:MFS transporter n=1 Tax=Rothia terrae TaxID=396015 RepID=UPI0028814182|nr:MFS transporter [Rothia terrae]MDT0189815.1 MFS transporter [Rothia terrae]
MSTTTMERDPQLKGQLKNVIMATLASTIGFWGWAIIGPLAKSYYKEAFHLTPGQLSALIAMPVIVGAVARIPVGALTDKFGGRIMFTCLLVLTSIMVLITALIGQTGNYPLLLVSAFFLGIGGSIFAVGIPFSASWYEPHRKGLATGIFGMGMIGTAVAAFCNPRMVKAFGYFETHLIIAAIALVYAVIVWFFLKDSPKTRGKKAEPIMPKIKHAMKDIATWELCFIYGVIFGAFVAFSNYIPTYMSNVYNFDPVQAGTFAALFATCAVVARPFGGVAADKLGPRPVTLIMFAAVVVLSLLIAQQFASPAVYYALFIIMAVFIGFGTGTVFGWVGRAAKPEDTGTVGGLVSAAGGLGGYFPPLVMGAVYGANGHYFWAQVALAITAGVALLISLVIKNGSKPKAR